MIITYEMYVTPTSSFCSSPRSSLVFLPSSLHWLVLNPLSAFTQLRVRARSCIPALPRNRLLLLHLAPTDFVCYFHETLTITKIHPKGDVAYRWSTAGERTLVEIPVRDLDCSGSRSLL